MKIFRLQVKGITILVTELGPDTYRVNYHFSVTFDEMGKPTVIGENAQSSHLYTTQDIVDALVEYREGQINS